MKSMLLVLSLLWVECSVHPLAAQSAQRAQVAGAVASVTASAGQFVLKTDKGDSIEVTTTDKTLILHMPAGVTDVTKATRMTVGAIGRRRSRGGLLPRRARAIKR